MTASHREATRLAEADRAPRRSIPSPAADRRRATRWRDPRIWLGAALVLVSMVAGARVLGSAGNTMGVWQLAHDVPAGVLVSQGDLRETDVSFDDPAVAAQYLPVVEAASGYATRDLHAGEMLSRTSLTTEPGAAARQLPLEVPIGGQPVGLTEGDRVDVWAVPGAAETAQGQLAGPGAPPDRARLLLRGVAVLSLGSAESGLSSSRQVLIALPKATDIGAVLDRLAGAHVVLVRLGG